ncbi:hypothetical protein ACSAZL_18330 [Methanosarcina sp. T3]|uniref:hypothetical protein n=1 Tax=Methanosarcina sp. T3 TaxID=3439062 RepID=UPI003F83269F
MLEESNQQNVDEQNDNALNDIWAENKDKFKDWLPHKKISEPTKRNYFNALIKFFGKK